jgi:hypothetical protein
MKACICPTSATAAAHHVGSYAFASLPPNRRREQRRVTPSPMIELNW